MSSYTYDDVCTAVNNAANMLDDLDSDTQTLVDFVVNATLTLLENTEAEIEDVLEANWEDSESRETIRDIVAGE